MIVFLLCSVSVVKRLKLLVFMFSVGGFVSLSCFLWGCLLGGLWFPGVSVCISCTACFYCNKSYHSKINN